MKEAFEKIIERLKEEKSDWNDDYNVPINRAIEIVNQVAEKFGGDIDVGSKDGWIPCSDRKPDSPGYYLASYKSCREDFVMIENFNGRWFDERFYLEQPIAWQPLPKPFRIECQEVENE